MIKLLIVVLIYLFGNLPEEAIAQHEFLAVGVVDRIEGELAVILLESDEKEIRVATNPLTKENKWLLIYWSNEQPSILWSLDNYEKQRQGKIEVLNKELQQKESSYP